MTELFNGSKSPPLDFTTSSATLTAWTYHFFLPLFTALRTADMVLVRGCEHSIPPNCQAS